MKKFSLAPGQAINYINTFMQSLTPTEKLTFHSLIKEWAATGEPLEDLSAKYGEERFWPKPEKAAGHITKIQEDKDGVIFTGRMYRKIPPPKFVYIVQLWNEGEWQSTVGIALTREYGRKTLAEWRECLPDDKLRLARYDFSMAVR